ncbi:hypothetical protein J2X42_002280 [Arthrobacter sp. BE255]|nr:hypothetical protein [Arthrobacter sp. BE255]
MKTIITARTAAAGLVTVGAGNSLRAFLEQVL